MHVTEVNRLLDHAKKRTGSDGKTAKALQTTPQKISNWRHAKAPMPAADVVLAAEAAGLDPVEWGSRAIASEYKGAKGEALLRALKKALPQIGAATASSFTLILATSLDFIRCIDVLTPARVSSYR